MELRFLVGSSMIFIFNEKVNMNECDFCKRESGCSEIDKIMNATKASTKLFKGGYLARPCLELVSKKKMFEALIQQDKIDKNEPSALLVAAPWCLG